MGERFNAILGAYFVTAGLLIGVSAFAASDAEVTTAAQQIEAILSPRIFNLDRDLIVFHYENADPAFSPSSVSDLAKRMAWGERFFDANVLLLNNGEPGINTALDSWASRDWGQDAPQLFAITLKKQSKLVAFTSPYSWSERQTLRSLSEKFGCYVQDPDRAPLDWQNPSLLLIFRGSSNLTCRKIIIEAFADLGIEAYTFTWAKYSLSGCRSRSEAISVVKTDAMRTDELSLYSDTQKIEGKPLADLSATLMRDASADTSYFPSISKNYTDGHDLTPDQLMPKSLQGHSIDNAVYQKWKAQFIFKCGDMWEPERRGLTK